MKKCPSKLSYALVYRRGRDDMKKVLFFTLFWKRLFAGAPPAKKSYLPYPVQPTASKIPTEWRNELANSNLLGKNIRLG